MWYAQPNKGQGKQKMGFSLRLMLKPQHTFKALLLGKYTKGREILIKESKQRIYSCSCCSPTRGLDAAKLFYQ